MTLRSKEIQHFKTEYFRQSGTEDIEAVETAIRSEFSKGVVEGVIHDKGDHAHNTWHRFVLTSKIEGHNELVHKL